MIQVKDPKPFYIEATLSVHSVNEPVPLPFAKKSFQERLLELERLKELYQVLPQSNRLDEDAAPYGSFSLQEALSAFVAHQVEFILIGGYAVAFHGYPRFTHDLDLYIQPTPENAKRIISGFEQIGFKHPELNIEGLLKPGSVYKIGKVPHQLELINEVKGITWDEAASTAISERLLGQKVRFLNLDTLIKSKKAAGRLQDLADVEQLERIQRDSWLNE